MPPPLILIYSRLACRVTLCSVGLAVSRTSIRRSRGHRLIEQRLEFVTLERFFSNQALSDLNQLGLILGQYVFCLSVSGVYK